MARQNEPHQEEISRIRRLAVFFIGIGFYALTGEILRQMLILDAIVITYITVGVVVGIVGILLFILLWYRASDEISE